MLEQLRLEVCECNKSLPKYGLVVMTSGTVSGRDPGSGLIVVKPSGYSFEIMQPEDMVVVDPEGMVVEGKLKPSVDLNTHLYIYKERTDVHGLVHTHSPFASIFAVLGQPIPPCLTASAMLGGEIPIGGLKLVGGKDIGEEIINKIGDKSAIIIQNHGVYTIGKNASEALKMAVEVEEIAKITHFALCQGKPILLSDEDIQFTRNIYENDYGQK
jgi:L-ribulose-5-phosphate 4-epimerase